MRRAGRRGVLVHNGFIYRGGREIPFYMILERDVVGVTLWEGDLIEIRAHRRIRGTLRLVEDTWFIGEWKLHDFIDKRAVLVAGGTETARDAAGAAALETPERLPSPTGKDVGVAPAAETLEPAGACC